MMERILNSKLHPPLDREADMIQDYLSLTRVNIVSKGGTAVSIFSLCLPPTVLAAISHPHSPHLSNPFS